MKCRVFQLKKAKQKKYFNGNVHQLCLRYCCNMSEFYYLTCRYYTTNWLTEKSDVYSFGIVLLEIVTSRPAILKPPENAHICRWMSSILAKADIKRIVDPRLQANFNINSALKVVDLAMACVSETATTRPTMSQVVMDLKQCLEVEIARTIGNNETKSKDSIPAFGLNFTTGLRPTAR